MADVEGITRSFPYLSQEQLEQLKTNLDNELFRRRAAVFKNEAQAPEKTVAPTTSGKSVAPAGAVPGKISKQGRSKPRCGGNAPFVMYPEPESLDEFEGWPEYTMYNALRMALVPKILALRLGTDPKEAKQMALSILEWKTPQEVLDLIKTPAFLREAIETGPASATTRETRSKTNAGKKNDPWQTRLSKKYGHLSRKNFQGLDNPGSIKKLLQLDIQKLMQERGFDATPEEMSDVGIRVVNLGTLEEVFDIFNGEGNVTLQEAIELVAEEYFESKKKEAGKSKRRKRN